MAEVLFYHLTDSTLESALPGLLEKSLERGWRAVVQTGSEERRDALDSHLWVWSEESFLAHATDREAMLDHQPIVLTCSDTNPNGAAIRFFCDGAEPCALDGYTRAVILFDGHDSVQLETARTHWKMLKGAGHAVTYWQQSAGRWEKKA